MSKDKASHPVKGLPPKEYPILWWTSWLWEDQFEERVIDFCGLPYTCRITPERSAFKHASTIIFHASMGEFDPKDAPLKDGVGPKKAWLLLADEALLNLQRIPQWTNMFTHLWSYHLNADFVQTFFIAGREAYSYLWNVMQKPVFTIEEKNQKRRQGLAPIAWIANSCKSLNHREYYVKQLQKHIHVDIYGKCLKNKEWPKNQDGTELDAKEVIAPYKFYLALESVNCDDYVTEQLERPLAVGVVPIVDGPKDYSPFIPNADAVIALDGFSTPADLAKYIQGLDKDDRAYMNHLHYKFPTGADESTWTHLSSRLREIYDTGDKPSDWGNDSRGAECKICRLTHDLAEGLVVLDAHLRISVDPTTTMCQLDKWGKTIWALDFWFSWVISIVVILGLLIALMSRRVRTALLRCIGGVVIKVQKRRTHREDEAAVPLIPLSDLYTT